MGVAGSMLTQHKEKEVQVLSGWGMLIATIIPFVVLFGAYKGTVRNGESHWGSPPYSNGPAAISKRGRMARRLSRDSTWVDI